MENSKNCSCKEASMLGKIGLNIRLHHVLEGQHFVQNYGPTTV